MVDDAAHRNIAVVGPKGQRATVTAGPNASRPHMDDSEPEIIYGLDGLTVEKISENQFRDYQGMIWTSTE